MSVPQESCLDHEETQAKLDKNLRILNLLLSQYDGSEELIEPKTKKLKIKTLSRCRCSL